MNIFFYIIIFIIGILFGSFYTLAVYRIPKKQDITHTHSYCPNCNSKLGFFELIPVLSYLMLRGRCKHCKEKIRMRYFILEISSGILFVLFAFALKLNFYNFNIHNIIFFIFLILYLTFLILIAGIDKEKNTIEKSVLAYGIIISIMYIVYLYIIERASIHRYVIYIILFAILLLAKNIISKKQKKESYTIGILLLIVIMSIFTGEITTIIAIFATLVELIIYFVINKICNMINKKISIGFFICVSNIISFLVITNLIA